MSTPARRELSPEKEGQNKRPKPSGDNSAGDSEAPARTNASSDDPAQSASVNRPGQRNQRKRDGNRPPASAGPRAGAPEPHLMTDIQRLFYACRQDLDQMYDRRERIVKVSRDITSLSKKLIFTLHRIEASNQDTIFAEALAKKAEIVQLFRQVSRDLKGQDYYRHRRSIGPGCEEYIEAISFLHFLQNGTIVTKSGLDTDFSEADGTLFFSFTYEEYVLGLADLSGELMRYAINIVAKGQSDKAQEICDLLRSLKTEYEIIDLPEATKKVEVMAASLDKVENACYRVKVRGTEFPQGLAGLMDLDEPDRE
ncbi:Translin family-domain-containing protein [Polychytrium aggregatum]|uniref:Translin family-domain-containing protein n=1 Tax=Polychytrium aggregatum TaxID=110093 RepID=UPI0022FEBD2F|nr:Translin family-domain-containing protein [Polychytrium aggregatum]KAI9208080.1 Translin family-domain-containing protein [Polychytrium aggregatum]